MSFDTKYMHKNSHISLNSFSYLLKIPVSLTQEKNILTIFPHYYVTMVIASWTCVITGLTRNDCFVVAIKFVENINVNDNETKWNKASFIIALFPCSGLVWGRWSWTIFREASSWINCEEWKLDKFFVSTIGVLSVLGWIWTKSKFKCPFGYISTQMKSNAILVRLKWKIVQFKFS